MKKKPRAIVIAANWWCLAGQISIALSKVGFRVAVVSPPASVVRKIKTIDAHYTYHPWVGRRSIARAIKGFSPDFIVCTDDRAVIDVHNIHARSSKTSNDTNASRIAELIETSLGNPSSYRIADAKSEFIAFAQSLGIRCPKTITITDEVMLEHELRKVAYPIVLKADRSCGGVGVRIVRNKKQAREAFHELKSDFSWRGAILEVVRGLTLRPLFLQLLRRRRTVTLQEYIGGRCANRAVICLEGRLLAGISVEVLETIHVNGPATLVRVIDHPEMRAAAKKLVTRLNLAGFCGFDFVIDSSNRAWLLEMNPRVTPVSSLYVKNHANLSAALFYGLTRTKTRLKLPRIKNKLIIIFPEQPTRLKHNLYASGFHDVPWDEPEYVRACSVRGTRDSFTGAMGYHLGELLRLPQKI